LTLKEITNVDADVHAEIETVKIVLKLGEEMGLKTDFLEESISFDSSHVVLEKIEEVNFYI
jgi:hypothetical protein